ncbi:MAG: DUF1501 domain-containing protein [Armatimonadetes bacterium]|nr:MAG: DUF1501 domain-containing protein [Armatimonadota bacterium]GIV02233.1 MAG: hypothetical protein KatS3mg015_1063 [Fimbriimonadales bacterium]
MNNELTRRDFLRSSALIALGLAAPPWLAEIARADILKLAKGGKVSPDNILVVCQLSGGNDGLNTVIPWSDANYYRVRPTLAVPEDQVLKATDDLGFHPSMTAFKELYDQKQVAIVQNVGYPNPNRSHFRSMEIWQTANPDKVEAYGWLGKYLDNQAKAGSINPVVAIGLTQTTPVALKAKQVSVPCFASLADIRGLIGDPDEERRLREAQGGMADGSASTIREANLAALDAMSELNKVLQTYESKFEYNQDNFGRGFQQIAQIIATSAKTRVIYFSAGGFDTHSQQKDQHARLLQQFSDALNTFMKEMKAIGKAEKVTVLVFTEFGRRVAENNSQGTDHGSGNVLFVAGPQVEGGFIGEKPDLVNLDRGDIRWKIDFRQVYSTVLDEWMGADSATLFGKAFQHVPIF